MTKDEFIQILCDERCSFYIENERIFVNIENSIFLNSLTELPDNIQFNNKGSVYLDSLTELSDSVQFNNEGYVYLSSLKKLPDNIQFNNKGGVHLSSLTELPDNFQFNNKGGVNLVSLTELPDNIQFNNGGHVYLSSLTELSDNVQFNNKGNVILRSLKKLSDNIQFNNEGNVNLRSLPEGQYEYQNQSIYLKNIDGFTMIIDKTKSINEMKIHTCRYFGGGSIDQLRKCYVAESNGLYAHGSTVKEAIEDLKCKLSKNKDISEAIQDVKKTSKVTLEQFRVITGACREGIRQHLSQFDVKLDEIDSMELDEAIEKMKGNSFGNEFIKQVKG